MSRLTALNLSFALGLASGMLICWGYDILSLACIPAFALLARPATPEAPSE